MLKDTTPHQLWDSNLQPLGDESDTGSVEYKQPSFKNDHICWPLVKSGQLKINILNYQPKHMLWVLKRTVSMRRFF